jgi:molybdate transport system substrate-binding protein
VKTPAGLVALLLVAACGSGSSGSVATTAATPKADKVLVFAASSLTKVFTAEGKAFQASHPGATVTFSFAGSQSLVAQLAQGAPADVLATADATSMSAARLTGARVFARNRLAIITAPGNPQHLLTLTDLARPGLRLVLGGPTVPVGRAARTALAAAHVQVHPRSLEQDVKGVVTKVRLGEADAGIAYATDVTADVAGVPLPGISNSYLIAVVRPTAGSRDFVDFVLSTAGQAILRAAGFLPPA